MSLIHSSYFRPRVYPQNGDVDPSEIDRVQDISGSITLNREKIKEVGTDGTIGWLTKVPNLKLTMKQLENGSMEFWRKLANKADSITEITLNDFKSSMVDICGYKTDDDGTFVSTIWYPKLRVNGFSFTIGDTQGALERSFDLVGEDEITLQGTNKYFIFRKMTAVGGGNEVIVISDDGTTYPNPVADPDNSGQYLFKVLRIRAGVTTELTYTTDYTFNGTTSATIISSSAGDIYKFYWSAGSYITDAIPFTTNLVDAAAIAPDHVDVMISTSTKVYKLQSVACDISFDRADYYEIGNGTVIQRGVKNKTVSIKLGRILDVFTIEEIMRGVAANTGVINSREFGDKIILKVRIYTSKLKTTLLQQYTFRDLSPTVMDLGATLDEYVTRGVTLEGENCSISSIAI